MLDKQRAAIAAVQQLLWDTALRIEDGAASLAERELRDALQQQLQDALAQNAPDAEIERLMHELQQAIDRYLQALAENMQRQGDQDQNQQPIDPSQVMSRAGSAAHARPRARAGPHGSRDAAREMLSQLQEMLENLRMAQPGPDRRASQAHR